MDRPSEPPKPEIVYPCTWAYAIIGSNEETVHAGVLSVMAGRKYTLKFSHRSKTGKYLSFHMETRVDNELVRNALFTELRKIPGVIQVI